MCAREMAVVRAILVLEVPGIMKTYAYAYSNILKILQPKKEHFQIKEFDIFHISAQIFDEAVLISTHNLCFLQK